MAGSSARKKRLIAVFTWECLCCLLLCTTALAASPVKSEGAAATVAGDGETIQVEDPDSYAAQRFSEPGAGPPPTANGRWVWYYEDGHVRLVAGYSNSKAHGKWSWWDSSGRLRKVVYFHRGHRQGPYVRFHDNGQRAFRSRYQDGVLHGIARSWHSNGALWQLGAYVRGKRHGIWHTYRTDGTLATLTAYRHGRQLWQRPPQPGEVIAQPSQFATPEARISSEDPAP